MQKRRFPRLSLNHEQFKLLDNGKVFAVADLSKLGMGLRVIDEDDLSLFPVMREFAGTLRLGGQKHPIRARVKNVRRDRIGCEFIEISQEASDAIHIFLDPVRLGPDLKPVSLLEAETTWYHAVTGTDVLVWNDAQGVPMRFGVYIFGSYVQWDTVSGLATGRIAAAADEESIPSGLIRLETMILDPDPKPDLGKVDIAKTLILSSNLAQEIQTVLLSKLA